MPAFAAEPASPTDVYRRAARRLRCRYAGRLGELHQSLKRLSAETPARGATPPGPRPAHVVVRRRHPSPIQTAEAQRFADHLADQMTSSVLRYSQRLELLRASRRFGVSRFEANLLIAAVLERRRSHVAEREPAPEGSVLPQFVAFLLIQSAMLLGIWWTLFH